MQSRPQRRATRESPEAALRGRWAKCRKEIAEEAEAVRALDEEYRENTRDRLQGSRFAVSARIGKGHMAFYTGYLQDFARMCLIQRKSLTNCFLPRSHRLSGRCLLGLREGCLRPTTTCLSASCAPPPHLLRSENVDRRTVFSQRDRSLLTTRARLGRCRGPGPAHVLSRRPTPHPPASLRARRSRR